MAVEHRAIIDLLSANGCEDVALAFYEELDEKPDLDVAEIFKRKAIREAILAGELSRATELISADYPGVFVKHPDLAIDLRVSQLIAMIEKSTKAVDVVMAARADIIPMVEQLPRPEDRQRYLLTLNKTMSLIIRVGLKPSEIWDSKSIYANPEELAASVDARLNVYAGTALSPESEVLNKLIRVHQWAEEMDAQS